MARGRSRVRGTKSAKRLLKNMPDAMRTEMVTVLKQSEPDAVDLIQKRIAATITSRSGNLMRGVKARTYEKSLRMRAGFLGTPRGRAKLFYARILDLGRKAQTVRVVRGRGSAAPYEMKVRAIAGKRFVTGQMRELGRLVGRRLRGVWDRGLRRIAAGDD